MFSTYDSPDARYLKGFILTDKGEFPVPIPPEFSNQELLIQTWPRQAQLQLLAEKLAARSWLTSPFHRQNLQSEENQAAFSNLAKMENRPKIIVSATQPDRYPEGFERIHAIGFRVEVWKLRLDSRKNSLDSQEWMSATATIP